MKKRGKTTPVESYRNERRKKLLHLIDKEKDGLEIGPSHNPIAPKREGWKVSIIDHLDENELIKKFSEMDSSIPENKSLRLQDIEEVDFVWAGEKYADLTGKRKHYGWVIASHVIEHTPDFVGFLQNCDDVLKDHGVVSLAIPDKRYCFDHYRPISGIGQVIDSHLGGCAQHSPGTAVENFLYTVTKGGKLGWSRLHEGEFKFLHRAEEAIEIFERLTNRPEYVDFHKWCFTPHSFRLLIQELNWLGLVPFRECCFFETRGSEFFVTLGREGGGTNMNRNELLKVIEQEISYGNERTMRARIELLRRRLKRLVLGQG
jgi:SAM-dependent methyltransferase